MVLWVSSPIRVWLRLETDCKLDLHGTATTRLQSFARRSATMVKGRLLQMVSRRRFTHVWSIAIVSYVYQD
jgi:hypothetical protein